MQHRPASLNALPSLLRDVITNQEKMKKDEPGKTRNFIKKGLILWAIVIGVFVLMKVLINNFGDLSVENSQSGFFDQLSGIVFIFGICGIPIILLFSVILKFAEKSIDKIGNDKNKRT